MWVAVPWLTLEYMQLVHKTMVDWAAYQAEQNEQVVVGVEVVAVVGLVSAASLDVVVVWAHSVISKINSSVSFYSRK